MDITAEYKEVMKRCDCCRHEGMRFWALLESSGKPNKGAVCKKCSAELRLEKGSNVFYSLFFLLLWRGLSLFASVFLYKLLDFNPLRPFLYCDEVKEAYLTLYNHPQMAEVFQIERIKTICVLFVLETVVLGIMFGLEWLVGKTARFRKHLQVVRYPHPEDGKIVL